MWNKAEKILQRTVDNFTRAQGTPKIFLRNFLRQYLDYTLLVTGGAAYNTQNEREVLRVKLGTKRKSACDFVTISKMTSKTAGFEILQTHNGEFSIRYGPGFFCVKSL